MHSTSYVSTKLKKKKNKFPNSPPFSPLKSLSYKNLHDSPQKVCMEALQFDVRYAAGCRGAGAGGWRGWGWEGGCGVECSLIPLRGVMGMGLFFTPSLSKWASFYVVRF